MTRQPDWSLGVFAANEGRAIADCLRTIDAAAAGRSCELTVMLNGTTDSTLEVIRATPMRHATLAVRYHPVGDKATAINNYLSLVAGRAPVVIMMDAYVRIEPAALATLTEGLAAAPEAVIASGVPRNGRSAPGYSRHIAAGGAINGNLYAMRREFVAGVVERGFRLPFGLYRTDPLLGSMAAHDLDAVNNPWRRERMVGVPAAGYSITPLSPFRWDDIRRQFRRDIRQTRGLLERAAIQDIIYRANYGALPDSADEMLRRWLATHSPGPMSLRRRLFLPLALRELRAGRARPAAAAEPPALVFQAAPAAA